MDLFKNTNIQFVKNRYVAYAFSIILILASIGGIVVKGLNWSIDFSSGVAIQINLKANDASVKDVSIDQLRTILTNKGFPEAQIQYVGDEENSTFMIKIRSLDKSEDTSNATSKALLALITESFPEHIAGRDIEKDVVLETNVVGPKVGGELRTQALLAVLVSLVLMIIYIWFRFEFIFGLMAIVALFHDVIIILGAFALTGREVSVQIIAALLTIVGYSINDTIVVFDRIREDMKANRKADYHEVFNTAINRTLSRTVITAGTTLVTALALYFFGGSVIHDFALAITLGLFFGTYSSIFVASNLVVETFHMTHKEKDAISHLTKKKK